MIGIAGDGLASRAVAQLLRNKELPVQLMSTGAPSKQIVLLDRHVVRLIEEIFDIDDLSRHGHPVEGRRLYQPDGSAGFVAIPGLAIRMEAILEALPRIDWIEEPVDVTSFVIDATGRSAVHAKEWSRGVVHRYGARVALCATVPSRTQIAHMEITASGWTFAVPISRDTSFVQSIMLSRPVSPKEAISARLSTSSVMSKILDLKGLSDVVVVSVAPQMPERVVSSRGLAIGAAAFAMDPIAGNGVGSALHGALLAAAVCDALSTTALAHHQARNRRSFAAHLRHVADSYRPLARNIQWGLELRGTFSAVQLTQALLKQELSYSLQDGVLRHAHNSEAVQHA